MHSGYAPVNGIRMYYELYGNGSIPLVMIHGGGSTIDTSFGRLIPMLMKKHRLIAVELQAHGRTSDRDAPGSFEQDGDDVAVLLEHLQVDKADFLGFSNGGTTVLQISHRHPSLVQKIIVISANYKRDGMVAGFFDELEKANLTDMPELLKQGYLKVAPDPSKLETMFRKDRERMLLFKDIPEEQLRTIIAPALLIGGDRDVVLPDHMIQMSRALQNARLAILPGTHGSFIGEICAAEEDARLTEMTALMISAFLEE
jgi:pimeloyl-ACP methyl ester carboxylesterase